MQYLLRSSVLGLLLLLSGCSTIGGWFSDDEGPEPAQLLDFDEEVEIETLWSKSVGKGVGDSFMHLRPAIDGDFIYVADPKGQVRSLEKKSGKQAWLVKLKTPITGAISAGYDRVLIGTQDGEVIALDQSNGEVVWRKALSSEILSVPASNGTVVVAVTLDEKIYGLDHDTGQQLWLFESAIPNLTMRGSSTPVISGFQVLAGMANGKLVSLNVDNGRQLWEKRVSVAQGKTELERMTDVDADPLVSDSTVFVQGFQGSTMAVSLSDAQTLWQKDISGFTKPAEGFGQIYLADDEDILYALEQTDGATVWLQSGLTYRELSPLLAFNNYLVVGDFEGYLHVLSQRDGHIMGRRKIDGDALSNPMIADDGVLYVLDNGGTLRALVIN